MKPQLPLRAALQSAHRAAMLLGDLETARALEFDLDAALAVECENGEHYRVGTRCWMCGREV